MYIYIRTFRALLLSILRNVARVSTNWSRHKHRLSQVTFESNSSHTNEFQSLKQNVVFRLCFVCFPFFLGKCYLLFFQVMIYGLFHWRRRSKRTTKWPLLKPTLMLYRWVGGCVWESVRIRYLWSGEFCFLFACSFVRHDLCVCIRGMAHAYVWRDCCTNTMRGMTPIHMKSMARIHSYGTTHSHVCRGAFTREVLCIYMCVMAHSCVWHDSFLGATVAYP